jgi:drug/metabolite transporter (DMT)-like permease
VTIAASAAAPGARLRLIAFLGLLGSGWGLTQSLAKMAVATGYREFGLIFWQLVIGVLVLGPIVAWRRTPVPVNRRTVTFAVIIALLGTVIANGFSFAAYPHLPAGIMSIIISAVPMLAFPIALALGIDRFSLLRLLGLACGLTGVALIALPDSALPPGTPAIWIAVALCAPLCYALEANVVAKWGTAGLDPIAAMFAASAAGVVIALLLALGSGQWIDPLVPWGRAEWALVGSSVIHAFMYAGYVWLVQRAGPVFAAQSSYVVTASGVFWAMALLGERFSGWVWLALAVMLVGVFLVQPRRAAPPA